MKTKLARYLLLIKTYVTQRSELFVGIGVVAALFSLVGIVVLVNQLSGPRIEYKPVKACDLLTPAEAQSLLGEQINGVDKNEPTITGDLATSKCSYSDLNAGADNMKVAAVAVQSGINDDGVSKNKSDFSTANAQPGIETVTGIGDMAFYNPTSGQLNVFDDRDWIILSFGIGSKPEQNTLESVSELARKVIR